MVAHLHKGKKMPKPKRREGESEASYFKRRQAFDAKEKQEAKAAGKTDAQIAFERRKEVAAKARKEREKGKEKPGKTDEQKRREVAAARRQALTSGITGLQELQDVLNPKKKKKR
jgi:hypothetical protein